MNIEFKRPELEDRDIIMRYFAKQKSRACECTFSCVYLWSRFYHVEYAIIEDMMVFKCGKEDIESPSSVMCNHCEIKYGNAGDEDIFGTCPRY